MPSTSYDIGKTNRRHFGVPTPVTRVWLTGRVGELSDSVMSINGTACGAVITLDGVSYRYHGTEPAAIQESPSDTFVNALELRLRNGDTFVMGRGENRLVAGAPVAAIPHTSRSVAPRGSEQPLDKQPPLRHTHHSRGDRNTVHG